MKLGNLQILVRPLKQKAKEEKIGSIIIPGTLRHRKKLTEAEVVECGKGTPDIPMEVKKDNKVLFHNLENRIKINDCILISLEDVLFINE
jgi:co-chaperonin GroES (HSP10)